MTENAAADPIQDVMMNYAATALARSLETAEALDRVTEALERLAASLRDA